MKNTSYAVAFVVAAVVFTATLSAEFPSITQ